MTEEKKSLDQVEVSGQPSLVPVKIVSKNRETALIEWQESPGVPRRAYVPKDKVVYGNCTEKELSRGQPYGAPWAEIEPKVELDRNLLEARLHLRGVWTEEDISKRIHAVNRSIEEVTGIQEQLVMVAKKHQAEV